MLFAEGIIAVAEVMVANVLELSAEFNPKAGHAVGRSDKARGRVRGKERADIRR